jgi:cytochrome b
MMASNLNHGKDKPDPGTTIRIWDLPTRVFHWLLVALFGFSWWTAKNDLLDWHMLSGYAILVLVLVRVYWGFVGSATARFATFLMGPAAFLAYVRRLLEPRAPPALGHNPMGGWSVIAFLLLLLLQAGLGLFAIDVEGLNAGPLDDLVSFETGRRAAGLHHGVFNLLLILAALHLTAVLFYWMYKNDNLIIPMITGSKHIGGAGVPPAPRFVRLWRAIPGLLAAGLLVAWVVLRRFRFG